MSKINKKVLDTSDKLSAVINHFVKHLNFNYYGKHFFI